ncbi:30S ribosomal protein S2 [Candidatus Dojkabacteria bacterium]|uniref:Small ribosomal subunit protein uS2 n=1 Tax=Candidatus Dojkabacteria bacterium TaxID=2099670 RepID=A0A955L0Z9_9BACT|nr:30S ribosomal protein S2 [Candidatus Dojkabacteria bacterium]
MAENKNAKKPSTASVKSKVEIPTVKDMFKAGVQFGHETRRWNPKMRKFLYDVKGDIHIIDVSKTEEQLKKAVQFLSEASARGNVLFVGTKKQASKIVKDNAVNCGAHFIDQRWAGGLLTNSKKVRESFARLRELETLFEKGVEGRTKYEISLMKKEWAKLSRLYSGVKTLDQMPKAMVIVDTKFEKNAVAEAVRMHIPIVGIIDSNSDPDLIDYPIPANDDAISSITLLVKTLAAAVREGNKDGGVKHHLKDYSKAEVQIIKKESDSDADVEAVDFDMPQGEQPKTFKKVVKAPQKKSTAKGGKSKGILEKVQEEKEKKKAKKK